MHVIHVEGMHCAHCEMLAKVELEDRGAKNVHADAETGTVTFDGDLTSAQVEAAIEAAGFKIQS